MNTILSILSLFGITPERFPYLILAVLIIAGFIWLKISLGGPLGKVKDNLLVIITHLSSTARSVKLNTALIKQMSPLQIQPEGKKVLEESGFISLFNDDEVKKSFFDIVDERAPKTKLDVENFSVFAFLNISSKQDQLTSVKTYLYQHPDVRDTFPVLAGVYIRDEYLSKHPEIKE